MFSSAILVVCSIVSLAAIFIFIGVYYLKKGDLDADDGHIYFKSPLVQAQTSLCYFGGKIVIPAKQGGLLLFPGWLEHGVNMNNSDEDRISVSFDITFNR